MCSGILCIAKMCSWCDSKGASESVHRHQRAGASGWWWPVQRGPPGGPQTWSQEGVQARGAEFLPSCCSHLPGLPNSSSSPAQEGGRWRGPPPLLPESAGRRHRRKTQVPQPGLCPLALPLPLALILAPAAGVPLLRRPGCRLSEREDEGDEGAAVCSQSELQRYQAAAHCPVTGPDEKAEEHSSRGLLHVLHEAPAQITLDILIVVGVFKTVRHTVNRNTDTWLTSFLFVNLFTSVFIQRSLSVNILIVPSNIFDLHRWSWVKHHISGLNFYWIARIKQIFWELPCVIDCNCSLMISLFYWQPVAHWPLTSH